MTMRRRRWVAGAAMVALVGGAGLLLVPGGCSGGPRIDDELRHTDARSQRLTALAAEEAGRIPDADARLTRLLNLADHQIAQGWPDDARATLGRAAGTLGDADAALNAHARIAGWVSVSELSRRADDPARGAAACAAAVEALHAVEDPAERCRFVMGLASEVDHLQGEAPAAALLTDAGGWARSIDDVAERRRALRAFATALFNLDRFEQGQRVLQQDDDAAWRSDTLLAMAGPTAAQGGRSSATPQAAIRLQAMDAPAAAPAEAEAYYGEKLDFGTVFRGQSRSQTSSTQGTR